MIRCYIAMSLDGYIAAPDGGVDWLKPFEDHDYGYEAFMAEIGTVVMGRHSYEQVLGFGDWPYKGKSTLVVTSRPLADAPEAVAARPADFTALAAELRQLPGDSWLVGGQQCLEGFQSIGSVGRLELFLVPVTLGSGIPLFKPGAKPQNRLRLALSTPYPNGVVKLVYDYI
ncbi:dihydrofolate reductase family protein [Ferrovibrio sp.]|uniref:dihydrofolate reductase family protein n=1 Tax=Ferrovibrio sp. TaxID=1917215 RepID=UPI001B6E98D1|nr:dihydrofolate reductase family protein [Ferrovibrio sp.]MBP7063556.1 dihydrofolate reductase [Ferrovibrio sp.]